MTIASRSGCAIVAALGFGAACPPRALAQAIVVTPVTLHLAAGHRATLLRITNSGAAPTRVQLRAFGWSQGTSGDDRLAPADEVVIGPPFATLAPGATQVVRLLLRAQDAAAAPPRERAYRLMIYRLPDPAAVTAGKRAIQLRLNLSLPVFVDPAAAPAAAAPPAWRIEGAPGHRELVVVNRGSRHLRVDALALAQAGGAPVPLAGNGSRYVLAGAERRWPLPTGLAPGAAPVTLTVKDGDATTTVVVAAPAS